MTPSEQEGDVDRGNPHDSEPGINEVHPYPVTSKSTPMVNSLEREQHEMIVNLVYYLRWLHDLQNGPPLFKYERSWNAAMEGAIESLKRAESYLESLTRKGKEVNHARS